MNGAGGSGGAGAGGTTGDGGAGGTGSNNGTSITCFPDADDDGYPSALEPMVFYGTCGEGYIEERVDSERDCNDEAGEVRPNQERFFDVPSSPTGWDYNCDGVDEREYEVTIPFSCSPDCSGRWWSSTQAPDCGETGDLVSCFLLDSCQTNSQVMRQPCH